MQRYSDKAARPTPNEFLSLRVRVTNLSLTPLVLSFDLKLEPVEHVLVEGMLTEISLGRLERGQSIEVETVICFLCLGHFEVAAAVRCLDDVGRDSKAGVGRLKVVVAEGN